MGWPRLSKPEKPVQSCSPLQGFIVQWLGVDADSIPARSYLMVGERYIGIHVESSDETHQHRKHPARTAG